MKRLQALSRQYAASWCCSFGGRALHCQAQRAARLASLLWHERAFNALMDSIPDVSVTIDPLHEGCMMHLHAMVSDQVQPSCQLVTSQKSIGWPADSAPVVGWWHLWHQSALLTQQQDGVELQHGCCLKMLCVVGWMVVLPPTAGQLLSV